MRWCPPDPAYRRRAELRAWPWPRSGLHQRRVGVEPRQHRVAGLGWQTEDRPRDAGRLQRVQRGTLGRREEDGDGRRLRIAPRLLQPVAQLGNPLDRVLCRALDRHPAVAELHDAVERRRPVAADDDRRGWALVPGWGWPRPVP